MFGGSVCLVRDNGDCEYLYEYINDINDAELLAQLAMENRYREGLIIIFPGHNRGIRSKGGEEYERALNLAKKYKAEVKKMGTLKKNSLENARRWLIKNIKENTNRFDFQILKETENDGCYYFDCKYKWSLNGWVKNVHSEIIVIYNEQTSEFVSPDFILNATK